MMSPDLCNYFISDGMIHESMGQFKQVFNLSCCRPKLSISGHIVACLLSLFSTQWKEVDLLQVT